MLNSGNTVKRQIPNLITLGNLLCGVMACFMILTGFPVWGALFICLGIFLDFFDGLAARLLHVPSPLGKELDSLADVVTSGVAPGFILLFLLWDNPFGRWFAFLALLMPLFTAYRLAKFNIDTRQGHSFMGLPAPANALIWVGLAIYSENPILQSPTVAIALAVISLVTDILMVSDIPMFSLKFNFKEMGWKNNRIQYIFLIGSIAIATFTGFDWNAISIIVMWYIALSLLTYKKQNA